jgi:hypothetical protein
MYYLKPNTRKKKRTAQASIIPRSKKSVNFKSYYKTSHAAFKSTAGMVQRLQIPHGTDGKSTAQRVHRIMRYDYLDRTPQTAALHFHSCKALRLTYEYTVNKATFYKHGLTTHSDQRTVFNAASSI